MEVKTLARDENCDLYVGTDGQLAIVDGKEAYAQIINAKMRTTLGEMQLAMQKGVPYFETVFADPSMVPVWQESVIQMLESLAFVIEVSSFICETKGNMLEYTSEIKTDKGMVTING